MPVFKIHHVTRYEYDRLVKESNNEIRVYPYQCAEQEILQHQLSISGQPPVHQFDDYWGNLTGTFNVMPPHKEMVIDSKVVVRTTQAATPQINFDAGFSELESMLDGHLSLLELSRPDFIRSQSQIQEMVAIFLDRNKTVAHMVEEAGRYVYTHFKYLKGITTIETTVDQLLVHQAGVCQDFAHVLLQLLRTMGVPSRYVSGYICPNKNGMRGEGATHAWVEAYIPGSGWAGLDPTNNVWVSNTHVKLAVGRNFNDCSPVKGNFRGPARQKLSVYVSVSYEDGHTFEDRNDVKQETADSSSETFDAAHMPQQ